MGDSISTRERKSLSKAKDLFNDILTAGLLRGKGSFWLTIARHVCLLLKQLFVVDVNYVLVLLNVVCEFCNIMFETLTHGFCCMEISRWLMKVAVFSIK